MTFQVYKIKHSLFVAVLFCFLYACGDELHQLFISMRSARILDVWIDTCGSLTGIGLVYFFKNGIKK